VHALQERPHSLGGGVLGLLVLHGEACACRTGLAKRAPCVSRPRMPTTQPSATFDATPASADSSLSISVRPRNPWRWDCGHYGRRRTPPGRWVDSAGS
jgi:hypothetical protein